MVLQRHDHRGKALLSFTRADVDYLTGEAGRAALAEVEGFGLTDSTLVSDVAALRRRFADRTGTLVQTTLLRRKAVAKFGARAARWLFTDEALQQATTDAVARHRAHRLAGRTVHDATCSIGTELAALHGVADFVVGSDIDEVRLAMAASNVPGVALCRADALRPITRNTVVLLDPARRSGGRRRFDPRAYTPGLGELAEAYRGRATVVKCAPGIDFDAVRELGFHGEIEVTSTGGSVREACLWSAGLTEPGVRWRATMLDLGEEVTDADPDEPATGGPGRWIVDPDGAVVRAGLVRQYATRHGLWQLDPQIAYLTGDRLPVGVRGFEILERVAVRERTLGHALSALDCGPLEILVRGVDIDPDALRRRLRPSGSRSLSVVILRMGAGSAGKSVAFICRPSR